MSSENMTSSLGKYEESKKNTIKQKKTKSKKGGKSGNNDEQQTPIANTNGSVKISLPTVKIDS